MSSHCQTPFLQRLAIRLFLAVVLLAPGAWAPAQEPSDDDIQQSVARVSYLSGPASYSRGDDPDNWQEAVVNFPMTLGDRLYTSGTGRMELQAPGARIFLGPETQLTALDLRDDLRQLSLSIGTASFLVRRLGENEVFEVDTPNVSVTFRGPGLYRVDVGPEGNTRVSLFEGAALAVAAGGQIDLASGEAIRVEGVDQPVYDIQQVPRRDSWDQWVDGRVRPRTAYVSAQYVHPDVEGVDDLDQYGGWEQVPDYGWAWRPHAVANGWVPYRDGRWVWQDPWGWTWVSSEPWGWAPYHYGSWVSRHSRWYWIPVGRHERFVRYAPARVVFTGGGPGWTAARPVEQVGYVGWFPIGPRDPFHPWWGRHAGAPADITRVTYVNRGFVTVVKRETFVGGGYVRTGYVRDLHVVHQVSTGPIFHGFIPFVPTMGAIRFASGPRHMVVPRPPDVYVHRSVVTRIAPPLAPPSFSTKMGFIHDNRGRPVDRGASERMSVDHYHGQRGVVDVRPAVPAGGGVHFNPRNDRDGGHRAQPVSAPQGRPLSTHDRPVASYGREPSSHPGRTDTRPSDRPGDRSSGRPPDHGRPDGSSTRPADTRRTDGTTTTTRPPESRPPGDGYGNRPADTRRTDGTTTTRPPDSRPPGDGYGNRPADTRRTDGTTTTTRPPDSRPAGDGYGNRPADTRRTDGTTTTTRPPDSRPAGDGYGNRPADTRRSDTPTSRPPEPRHVDNPPPRSTEIRRAEVPPMRPAEPRRIDNPPPRAAEPRRVDNPPPKAAEPRRVDNPPPKAAEPRRVDSPPPAAPRGHQGPPPTPKPDKKSVP